MVELFANSGDLDQTPHFAASDLGLHCLPITLQGYPDYNGLNHKYVWIVTCIEKKAIASIINLFQAAHIRAFFSSHISTFSELSLQ